MKMNPTRTVSAWTLFLPFALGTISSAARADSTLPAALADDIRSAEAEGAAIYRLDQAVGLAIGGVQRLGTFRDDKRIRGWVTEETPDGIRVTFYGVIKKKPVAFYRAFVTTNGLLAETPTPIRSGEPLSEYENAQRAAREKALTIHGMFCARHYDTVAILRDKPEGRSWSIYLLPDTKQDVMQAGGSYRVDIDWDGEKILAQRPFSKSCLEIPLVKGPNGEQTVGSYITHLLDPTPTPIHVLLSLQHHDMLAVGTTENSLMWTVNDGRIEHLDRKAAVGGPGNQIEHVK